MSLQSTRTRHFDHTHTHTHTHTTYLSDSLYRRSMPQKKLHHLNSVFLTGDVQGSETILKHSKAKIKTSSSIKIVLILFGSCFAGPAELAENRSGTLYGKIQHKRKTFVPFFLSFFHFFLQANQTSMYGNNSLHCKLLKNLVFVALKQILSSQHVQSAPSLSLPLLLA